ncbi:MAG: galactokinase [Candidatus Limnocylindrales bacterium]
MSATLREALAQIEPAARRNPGAVRVVRAPGRVNLIGEHTDYNDGFVLPAAIDLELRIALVPTDDQRVELVLAETGERRGFDLNEIGPRTGAWIDYVAGTAWALGQAGVATRGFRGLLASTIPTSAGLSSSAAIELASAWALTEPPGGALDGMALARICQRAENAYVGVNCGLMDQAAEALGQDGSAILLDCRSLDWRAVPLPLDRCRLVVCDTGSPRRLSVSQYNARRAQCESAVRVLARTDPSIHALRDVSPGMLGSLRRLLDEETYRRCEHVVRENERVLETVAALESGDFPTVGRCFAESHDSLRDLYEVSSPELEAMVAIARATPGVLATRMTGAGFGGCTISLVDPGAEARLEAAVLDQYPGRTGLLPRVFAVRPVAGAGIAHES